MSFDFVRKKQRIMGKQKMKDGKEEESSGWRTGLERWETGATPLKIRGNRNPVVPEKTCGETGCLFLNVGGNSAFQKLSLPNTNTSKTLYLQYVERFLVPFSASLRGKCFSPHFPKTENGRGFDSRCHIKCGVVITQVSSSTTTAYQ